MKLFVTLSLILLGSVYAHCAFADVKAADDVATDAPAQGETSTAKEALVPNETDDTQALVEPNVIYVKDYAKTLEIQALAATRNTMDDAVKRCMKQGGTNAVCLCEHITESQDYQSTLKATLTNHPEWIGQTTNYIDDQGVGITISFIGHQRQSEMLDNLQCSE
jgi:hypothetical protein|tara:strand:+ start:137461 stop:137952 length:492 start_codon:yes stop_codon:yes gene_type:complete